MSEINTEASGGRRERRREREVAKIVSILLILPQLAEAEMAEAAVQIITLSCLPGKYLLLSIKKSKEKAETVYKRKTNSNMQLLCKEKKRRQKKGTALLSLYSSKTLTYFQSPAPSQGSLFTSSSFDFTFFTPAVLFVLPRPGLCSISSGF